MKNSNPDNRMECGGKYPVLRTLSARAGILFLNFFLIIMVLYQLKPASRSLFIEYLGAERLPYAWIATALTMVVFITYYHRLVARASRLRVVLGSCLAIAVILIFFRIGFFFPGATVAIAFYVFVDILSVVLVEQFWSLTDSIYTTMEGRKWYGFVGTGGLVGGVAGGWISAMLIKYTPLQTPDLLLSGSGTVFLIVGLTWMMNRVGLYCEVDDEVRLEKPAAASGSWRIFSHSRYLLLIAAVLLITQLISPIIEYQFLNTVEGSFPEREARTAFLSMFFSLMGLVSIGINLGVTPVIHRYLGAIAGLLVQPIVITLFSWCFMFQTTLFFGGAMKISDRGLSYSINRASKELLYVPVDPVLIYQAKAWIDMFGYRLFKVAGSLVILLFTRWLPVALSISQLSWITVGMCAVWIAMIMVLRHDYQEVCQGTE